MMRQTELHDSREKHREWKEFRAGLFFVAEATTYKHSLSQSAALKKASFESI
jgi:hypothetical protein